MPHLEPEGGGEDDEECERHIAGDSQVARELRGRRRQLLGARVGGGAGVAELVVPEVCECDEHHVGEHYRHPDVVEDDPVTQEAVLSGLRPYNFRSDIRADDKLV